MAASSFDEVFGEVQASKEGIKEITYDQFIKIIKSDAEYILLDILSREHYNQRHIQGAISCPLNNIDQLECEKTLPKGANLIVYCASFACNASVKAAEKLIELGYKVLDYKGGLMEWQEKGNNLVTS